MLASSSRVEHEGHPSFKARAPSFQPHALRLRHAAEFPHVKPRQLGGLHVEELDDLGDGLAQGEPVRRDPQAGAHGEDAGVGALVEPEGASVLPDEAEHLVRVAREGLVVGSGVGEGVEGRAPGPRLAARSGGGGEDAVAREGLEEPGAEAVARVVRPDLDVRGEEGGEEVAELEVDGGEVVDRADGHGEEGIGDIGPLLGDALAVEEAGLDLAEGLDARHPDGEEGVHDGGDKDFSAPVGLLELGAGEEVLGGREGRGASEGFSARLCDLLPHLLGEAQEHGVAQGARSLPRQPHCEALFDAKPYDKLPLGESAWVCGAGAFVSP